MMKNNMRYVLLAAVMIWAQTLMAVIPDMKFRRLDTRHGLSSSQINCVFRDQKGYVWIGTAYGLNRYDGYRFKTFYSDKRDTTTMRDNYTDGIMEAYDGKLWMKQNMNYSVYDPKTELFERNAARELSKYLGFSEGVERVFIDAKKNFWVKYYGQGFYCYNPKTKKKTHINLGYGKNEFNPTFGISSMADFGDKVIAVSNCGEMVCMDGEIGLVEWEDKWMRENGGLENQDYKLTVDKDGNFWVITEKFTFIYIRAEKRWYSQLTDLLKARGIENAPDNLQVWDIKTDRHGRLWAATDHDGLFVIDLKNREFKQFLNNKLDESTISDNTPKNIFIDHSGLVWIGTYKNGVNQYIERDASMRSIEVGDINTVTEDRWGNWWLGSNVDGIIVLNPKTGEQLAHYTTANSPMLGNIMVGSHTASDGSIWFGSYNGGLTRCIPKGPNGEATIVNYRATGQPGDLAINNVWSVTEDHWKRIWIGTLGGGIQRLDLKTGKFTTWNAHNAHLPSDYLTQASWIKKGWLLVGTSYYYCFVNPVTGKVANRIIPESKNVKVNTSSTVCVMEDSRGLIWQGSVSGVCIFDQQRGNVYMLDMNDGLFGSSVCSVVEDHDHVMWVVTDHGVSKVIPEQQKDNSWQFIVRSYNTRDGLQQGTYNQRSAYVTRQGLILIGGQGGMDIINPKALREEKSKEHPIFSGLQIFDEDVPVAKAFDGRIILDENLNDSRELTLPFGEQFTIQLASDAGIVNNGKRFVYRLEGFNENWIKTSELNPNITYNSLRAGNYTLYVRMLNDDGTLGEEEASMDITIRPPLWRTRWMILLYMLLIAGLAFLWRKWFMKRQHRLMEVERTRRELEKKQWMNEMRVQLAQEKAGMQASPADQEPVAEQPAPIVLNQQVNDMVPWLQTVCQQYTSPIKGKPCKIMFHAATDSLEVNFDEQKMQEVFTTLFGNSIQFSAHDSLITVGITRTRDNKAYIQVADNGIGIRDEYKEHAFDPMANGEGIGLDRVKQTIVAHGGDIHIEDNPGGGTIFVITLPAEEQIEEAVIMDE